MKDSNEYQDPEIDWDFAYAQVSRPILMADCGSMCNPDGSENQSSGKGMCCKLGNGYDDLMLFPSEAEYRRSRGFFAPVEDDDVQFWTKCPTVDECERDLRPFICRTYPFLPVSAPNGGICGLAVERDFCKLDLLSVEWLQGWFAAWREILRHKGVRRVCYDIVIEWFVSGIHMKPGLREFSSENEIQYAVEYASKKFAGLMDLQVDYVTHFDPYWVFRKDFENRAKTLDIVGLPVV